MEAITDQNKIPIGNCLTRYQNWIAANIDDPVMAATRIRPDEIQTIFNDLEQVNGRIGSLPKRRRTRDRA